jgi:hypothetical protein
MLARVLGFFAAKDPDFQQKPGENSDRSSEDEPEILSKTEHSEILRGLLEYTRFPHGQGFAVVLNGPWGSGKTKFIQQNLQHFTTVRSDGAPEKPLYVSLYGVSDIAQIEDRLFEQLHPFLSHKATRLAGAVLRGAAKTAIKVDVNLSSMLKKTEGRIIIFDDFERASMSPIAILGYINPFVEHEDCKVIILADENQIDDKEKQQYQRRKEKTIGRTFKFKPDVCNVYRAFLREVDDLSARRYLATAQTRISGIFADSKYENLRLLKQFMWDFERVWKTMTPKQRNCKVAVDELSELLCASALELRQGFDAKEFKLQTQDSIFARHLLNNKYQALDICHQMYEKYPTVRFDSTLLTSNMILDIILKSTVDQESIVRQIESHPYITKPSDVDSPSWRALWSSYELSAAEQETAVKRFEADFEAVIFTERSVVYHVIGLAIWLSDLGFEGWNSDRIEQKLKNYVDSVYSATEPTEDDVAKRMSISLDSGSHGLGYRNIGTVTFRNLVSYEKERRLVWRRSGYPRFSNMLFELAQTDSEGFLRAICHTASGPATFASIGVMSFIPPWQFAKMVSSLPYANQTKILMGLSIRYEHLGGYPELEAEILWLKALSDHLSKEARELSPIAQDALLNLVKNYVKKHVDRSGRHRVFNRHEGADVEFLSDDEDDE